VSRDLAWSMLLAVSADGCIISGPAGQFAAKQAKSVCEQRCTEVRRALEVRARWAGEIAADALR